MVSKVTRKKRKSRAKKVSSGEWRPAFLASLRNEGNVKEACRRAKIARKTAYQHRNDDIDFQKEWDTAMDEAIEVLELEASRRARKTSDVLLIFLLKSHRPERYREHKLTPLELDAAIERQLAALGLNNPSDGVPLIG